jgi:hypothetical protein
VTVEKTFDLSTNISVLFVSMVYFALFTGKHLLENSWHLPSPFAKGKNKELIVA